MFAWILRTFWPKMVKIYNAGLKRAARGLLEMPSPKNCQKVAIWAPSHNIVRLYLSSGV